MLIAVEIVDGQIHPKETKMVKYGAQEIELIIIRMKVQMDAMDILQENNKMSFWARICLYKRKIGIVI